MKGLKKLSQSESAWEVSTAVSSRESGYHSGSWPVCGHSQDQLQSEEEEKAGVPLGWPGHLYTRQEGEKEEKEETELDLLDSLIMEEVKERLQQQTVSGSSLVKLRRRGKEHWSTSEVQLDTFIQNNIPLVFPGQVQSVSLPHCVVELINLFLVQVNPSDVSDSRNYSSELQKVNSFLEQDIPLAFPGQNQHQSKQVSLLFKQSWN